MAVTVPAFLPGTALAHGDVGEGWINCYDTATADVVDGGGVSEGKVVSENVEFSGIDTGTVDAPDVVCSGFPEYAGGAAGHGGVRSVTKGRGPRTAGAGEGVAAVCPGPGGAGAGIEVPVPRPDSSSADIDADTGSADVGDELTSAGVMSPAGWRGAGLSGHAASTTTCGAERAALRIGGIGDGVVAPSRIDAGGGATAPPSSNAPVLGVAAITGLAAAAAATRRRGV